MQDMIFSLIGQFVAAGGGGALVAYGLFKFLGKSWMEKKLSKDLELVKSEISILAARRMRLHDQEYVVFPEVWSKLNKAFESLGQAVISFHEIPDLSRMSEGELQDWLNHSDLSDDERKFLAKESDKTRAYSRLLNWRDLLKANRDFFEFRRYFQENRIFLDPQVKEKLDEICNLFHKSWVAKKMDWEGHRLDGGKSFLMEAYEMYDKQAKPIMDEIEALVQNKLFPETRV